MTTTAASRHAKIGVERPSTPHAHTGNLARRQGPRSLPARGCFPSPTSGGAALRRVPGRTLRGAGGRRCRRNRSSRPARPGDHLGTAGRLVTTVDPRLASALGGPQHTRSAGRGARQYTSSPKIGPLQAGYLVPRQALVPGAPPVRSATAQTGARSKRMPYVRSMPLLPSTRGCAFVRENAHPSHRRATWARAWARRRKLVREGTGFVVPLPLHQLPGSCRASEDVRLHRAGVHQEPAALLHPPGP